MPSKTALRTREKGTGTVYKEKNRFYLEIIINGKTKTKMLRKDDGSPCTTRKEADRAADGMRKILFADTLEETAHFVQEAKRLKKQSGLLLAQAWEVYLKQPDRPDSGESTLGKYKSAFEAFLAWVSCQYPKIQLVADIDRDVAREYMQVITQSGDSNATYNKYLQTLRLIFKHLMIPAALDTNPFDGISKKPIASTSRREFTPEQVKAIFDGFDNGFFYDTEVEKLTEGRKRQMLPCEPVMVVVKVPPNKDSPLSSEIVLLDTPGLDSGISEWTASSSERYSWIIENSDLLLFLQSSVAPLNRNATKILRDIHARSPNTPVWLVQNEMCAKPWLPPERITEENTKQRTQAARMFNTVSRAFKQVYSNLGKADSAIFDDVLGGKLRKELLNESLFASVEANIKYDLIRNIGPIRRQNCIDAVKREVQVMQDGLTEITRRLEDRIRETKSRMDAIVRFKSQFRDYMLTTPRDGSNPAVDEVRMISNGHFNPVKYKRELHYCHDFEFNGKVLSRGKLQRIISEQKVRLVEQMKDDIRTITTDDFMLSLRRNGEHRNNICKYVHETFRDFVLRMLKDDGIKFEPCFPSEEAEAMIRTAVAHLQLPGLHDDFFVNVDEATGKMTISVRKLKTWQNLFWEFHKRNTDEAKQVFADYFNPITEAGPFAEMIEAVVDKIREGIAAWMNETAFDALRADFITKLDEALINRRCESRETLSLIERDVAAIKAMLRRCFELKNQMKAL